MSVLSVSREQLAAFIVCKPPRPIFDQIFKSYLEYKKMFNEENEDRFFKMLEAAPELSQYWDKEESNIKMKSIQTVLHRRPKEECVLLRFFGSVWFGNSDMFDFDFIHSVKSMSERDIKIVRKWLISPFFC
ncbi:hypothetical protein [Marinomonas sp. 2405UD68-3]|uniref:hypothetical protein n=1 Tax=Marinomonas sp. 2405UD68-3 TaxID=3391835 RepID=UPI0039C9A3D1